MVLDSSRVRSVQADDAASIVAIYNHYVHHTAISFEEHPVDEAVIAQRIEKSCQAGLPWLVVEQQGQILGYAYASYWNERSAYRFTVEVSIYLAADESIQGKGIGGLLYSRLIAQLNALNINTVLAVVALPNPASVALHQHLGFEKVGHFKRVGYKFGQWRDVSYWQLEMPQRPAVDS